VKKIKMQGYYPRNWGNQPFFLCLLLSGESDAVAAAGNANCDPIAAADECTAAGTFLHHSLSFAFRQILKCNEINSITIIFKTIGERMREFGAVKATFASSKMGSSSSSCSSSSAESLEQRRQQLLGECDALRRMAIVGIA
jgi:hypothetical protein